MGPLQRHRLAWLGDAAWRELLRRPWDAQARAALECWARRELPCVVARQGGEGEGVALGIALPVQWQRRRIALRVSEQGITRLGDFPALEAAMHAGWPQRTRERAARVHERLASVHVSVRVFGSHGWQILSGLPHVHAASDLDLLIHVHGAREADAVVSALAQCEPEAAPRLDGELVFPDGAAVAWREWLRAMQGQARQMLVKRLDRVGLGAREAFA
jgi:phosphoribosyl-dephospho-CoA transferase